MIDEKKPGKFPQNIIMENRKFLSVSGVSDIDSFDDKTVAMFTEMGMLVVKGFNLHINKLNVETGELTMEGDIASLSYSQQDKRASSQSLLSRLFK